MKNRSATDAAELIARQNRASMFMNQGRAGIAARWITNFLQGRQWLIHFPQPAGEPRLGGRLHRFASSICSWRASVRPLIQQTISLAACLAVACRLEADIATNAPRKNVFAD